ncbi:MAG: hypothetical protein EAY75_04675 [Bacteroidetes bacterium]|nr:MAG: hypothetical protein EAY75_04675 [Bacteroidota bacterium]
MTIVIADANQSAWVRAAAELALASVVVVPSAQAFARHLNADAFVDLDFTGAWYSAIDKPLLINETAKTLPQCGLPHQKLARFCGWAGFCERPLWEVATANPLESSWLPALLAGLGKEAVVVQDVPGLVGPRVVAMLANEACHALADGVATEADIDRAMRLGTNYPWGPLEWSKKIGPANLHRLLQTLAADSDIYEPHALLKTLN